MIVNREWPWNLKTVRFQAPLLYPSVQRSKHNKLITVQNVWRNTVTAVTSGRYLVTAKRIIHSLYTYPRVTFLEQIRPRVTMPRTIFRFREIFARKYILIIIIINHVIIILLCFRRPIKYDSSFNVE